MELDADVGAAAQIPGELPRARREIDEILAHRTPGGLRQKSERKGPSSGSSRRRVSDRARLAEWCWTLAVKSGVYLAYYQAETDLAKPTP
jgi:signal transduction histidine kinase